MAVKGSLPLDDLAAVRELFKGGSAGRRGRLFCPNCGEYRSIDASLVFERAQAAKAREFRETAIKARNAASISSGPPPQPGPDIPFPAAPAVLGYVCRECGLRFTAFIYSTEAGDDLFVVPHRAGGMRTPNTPAGVAFYLDQAARAESAAARSAAVAMYRGALEQLLFEQGYKTGMLGKKLQTLEREIAAGTAPKWARDLETEFLTVLKDLGNSAIHPNNGDTTQQALLDGELLARVKQVFLHLLDLVYEAPLRKKASLDALKKTALSIKR